VAELENVLSSVAEGAPAAARTALSTADGLIRTLQSNGYPDASLADIDALADGAGHTLELTFAIDPGAFSTFGALEISPALRTRATYIERLKPWTDNETFSAEKLSVFRQRLSDTGLYSTVAVEPQESERTGTTERTLRIDLEERPRRTIALGGTLSTSDGIGVDGAWELRNVTGRGDSLEAVAQLATREDSIEIAYGAPNRGRYGRDARIAARYADTRTDAFDQRGVTLVATMKEPLSRSLLGAIGVEASYASISDERSRGLREGDREAWTLGGSAEVDLATTDDVLDPRQGVRARLKAEPSLGIGDTIIGLTRLHADASYYVSFWDERGTLALRARLGAVFSPPGAPPGKLFFAGGGGSVRGFDFQSLSPAGDDGAPKGGRSLTEGSLEIRFRTRARAGYVVFIDAGRAGADPAPTLKNLGIGAGVGLRYDAGFGPLRADIAFPLNRRDGDAAAHLYLSIGQAF
jgi:translocation and assembly module TamA